LATLLLATGVGFYFDKSIAAWRGPLAVGCVPCVVLLVGLWWLPESPRFLLMKDRAEEAWKVMHQLHATSDIEYVQREMFQMQRQIELDRKLPSSWLEMFRRRSYRKRMGMAIFICFAIQASGR